MLLRLNANGARGFFTEMEEPPYSVAEFRKLLKSLNRHISLRCLCIHIYIVSRHISLRFRGEMEQNGYGE